MRTPLTLLIVAVIALASCSTTQSVLAPYHLVADASAGVVVEANSQGLALCAPGDVQLAVVCIACYGTAIALAKWQHAGQLGPVAYQIHRSDGKWQARRLAADDGARRYPEPFRSCNAQLRVGGALYNESVVWREKP